MGDQDVALQLLIDRVQDRLDRQFEDNDALDAKALGVLGADAAAIGVLVAVHGSLGALWPAPVSVLVVAGLFLLYAVLPRTLDRGPNWREFYERSRGSPLLHLEVQMLSELLIAVEANDDEAPSKATVFKIGFAVMVAGFARCDSGRTGALDSDHGSHAASARAQPRSAGTRRCATAAVASLRR